MIVLAVLYRHEALSRCCSRPDPVTKIPACTEISRRARRMAPALLPRPPLSCTHRGYRLCELSRFGRGDNAVLAGCRCAFNPVCVERDQRRLGPAIVLLAAELIGVIRER